MVIGYTAGVFDLFHIGHLTLLKNAKALCDKLIVGVTVDELVLYKGKHAMIPFSDRAEIVRSIKYVDAVVPQYDMDKLSAWNREVEEVRGRICPRRNKDCVFPLYKGYILNQDYRSLESCTRMGGRWKRSGSRRTFKSIRIW